MSPTLASIYTSIGAYPTLLEHLTLVCLIRFIKCASALRRDILLTQAGRHPSDAAPEYLPWSIEYFLGGVTGLSQENVRACWQAMKDIVWSEHIAAELNIEPLQLFQEAGHELGVSKWYQ